MKNKPLFAILIFFAAVAFGCGIIFTIETTRGLITTEATAQFWMDVFDSAMMIGGLIIVGLFVAVLAVAGTVKRH